MQHKKLREVRVIRETKLGFVASIFVALLLLMSAGSAQAQNPAWFNAGTGLGDSTAKPRIAVPDFVPREDPTRQHSQLFAQVVRDDLTFSGIIDVVSPSFYPQQLPSVPAELKNITWTDQPLNANMVAFGNLTQSASEVAIQAWLNDVRNPSGQPIIGKVYRGAPTDAQVRKFAHQFADEIISKLSGGIPGIASTQIAFVSSRGGNKEIWVMDYDGQNQHPLTSLKTISLTPRWSPDLSRIAFTCFAPVHGLVSPQICMYSVDANKVITFPRFNGASSSPAWNPKTGQTVVYVSDRGGIPKLYMMNADGTNSVELDLPDKGYLIDPAWSPNGALLAFSWRRPDNNYDIYVMDPTSRSIVQITRDTGRNERPSWAPDGRHIVFESTRTGTRQIWTMLADGSQAHMLTATGHNESPNWSTR